jgi:hypothetical protein
MIYSSSSIPVNRDLFNKYIPEELLPKKTGMNILLMSDWDIAGQMSLLMKMINSHTIHKCRLIIFHRDWANHDIDIALADQIPEQIEETFSLIKSADFYHFGRGLFNLQEISWNTILNPHNCVIQYYGSEIRNNLDTIIRWHEKTGFPGLATYDPTTLRVPTSLFYHIPMMIDFDLIDACTPIKEEPLRICHPSSNRALKNTDLFLELGERLRKELNVEFVLIENTPNKECLKIKQTCQMTFDQIAAGYGVSGIESMAMGHVVFGGMSNFVKSELPNCPVVAIDKNNAEAKIREYIDSPASASKREIMGDRGKEFAFEYHNPHRVTCMYVNFYDYIINGVRSCTEYRVGYDK